MEIGIATTVQPLIDALEDLERRIKADPVLGQKFVELVQSGEQIKGVHIHDGINEIGPSEGLRWFIKAAEVLK